LELLVVLIVLGGLWAALLLPSFLDSRHDAPLSSTKSFDRRLARLASLRAGSIDPLELKRQQLLARRRRVMVALVGAALVTLVAAILSGSIPLLLLSLAFDGMFVAYLAALNAVRLRPQATRLPHTPEPVGYGELRLVSDDDFPQAASR
jgi:Zn-dependent protease